MKDHQLNLKKTSRLLERNSRKSRRLCSLSMSIWEAMELKGLSCLREIRLANLLRSSLSSMVRGKIIDCLDLDEDTEEKLIELL